MEQSIIRNNEENEENDALLAEVRKIVNP
jgi:hypothetical protein